MVLLVSAQDAYEWMEITLLSGKMLCINKMQIVQITASYMNDIVKQIQQMLKKLEVPSYIRKRILLTGQGSKLFKLNELLETNLKADIDFLKKPSKEENKIENQWVLLNSFMEMHKMQLEKTGLLKRFLNFLGF